MEENQLIQCENCHASIPKESAKCPYCGAFNFYGGEKQYMEQLFDIKEEVEDLQAVPTKLYQKEIGKTGKLIRTALILGIVLIGFLGIFYLTSDKFFGYGISSKEAKEQLLWEKENFPKLDAMYEQEDYEGIVDFIYGEGAKYSTLNWKHSDFIGVYQCYIICLESYEEYEKDGYKQEDMYWCILDTLSVIKDRSYAKYSEKEQTLIDAYQKEVKKLSKEKLSIEEETLQQLYEQSCKSDEYGSYFSYEQAEKVIKKYLKTR